MKILAAVAALAVLSGCMATSSQCVQPDPLEPQTKVFNKGVNAGEPLQSFNQAEAPAKPAKKSKK